MGLKKDNIDFFSKDVTQAYFYMLGFLGILLAFNLIDSKVFETIVKWTSPAYFGQFITNTEVLRRAMWWINT